MDTKPIAVNAFSALDLRALQQEFIRGLEDIIKEELTSIFDRYLTSAQHNTLLKQVIKTMEQSLDKTTNMDNADRMREVAGSTTTLLLDFLMGPDIVVVPGAESPLTLIPKFRANVASSASTLLDQLRKDYLSGDRGAAPATPLLGKTKVIYEFVRINLGVHMHGAENHGRFVNGVGADNLSIGEHISRIHEV